jgi:hypothetical protein
MMGGVGTMGVWNNPPGAAAFALVDTAGVATGATVAGAAAGGFACNDPTTGFAHTRLYDDGLLLGPPGVMRVFTVGPLLGGVYEVFTYAWAPCVPPGAVATQVAVPGSIDPPQVLIKAPFAGHAPGITFARHQGVVVPPGGFIAIQLTTIAGNGRLNGFQINQVP